MLKVTKNSYFNLISAFWRFSDQAQRRNMLLAGSMFVVANVVKLSKPMILALMLNEIQKGVDETLFAKILVYLCLFAGASFTFWLLHGPARVLERNASFVATKNYTNFLYEKVSNLPFRWHKDHHSGHTIDRMRKSYEALKNFSDYSYVYIQITVKLILSFGIILWIFPSSAVMALFFAVLIFLGTVWFNDRIVDLTQKLNTKNHAMMSSFFDYISNIKTVLTLNLQQLTQREFSHRIELMKSDFSKRAKINELKWFAVSMVVEILVFLILLGFLFIKLKKGEVILIGSIVALFQYTNSFVTTFFDFTYHYEELILQNTDFCVVEPIIKDANKYEQKNARKKPARIFENIKISKLFFTYADDHKKIHQLKNIQLELARGKKIAFVGESGSGKSTLMTLLRGLEAPESFNLLVNGKKTESFYTLSRYSTLIPQEPEIFENTILFNISFGISHCKKEIMQAIELANFQRVLARLPKGLESNMQEKGVNLSGGEKQRLALARGLFAAISGNSQIILLDESTSSVDAKNDAEIFANILTKFKDICIIAALHKLYLCDKFDEIYVFQDGEIIERGTFDELIKSRGKFYELWRKQQF